MYYLISILDNKKNKYLCYVYISVPISLYFVFRCDHGKKFLQEENRKNMKITN